MKTEQINKNITLFKKETLGKTEPIYFNEDVDSLSIHINIKGESEHKSLICDYCGESIFNHTHIDIINHYEGFCNIDADDSRQFIGLSIKKDFLYTLLPENSLSEKVFNFFEGNESGQSLSTKKTNFKIQALAQEIFNSPYGSTLDKLYIEAKSLELIHTEFNTLFKQKDPYAKNMIKLSTQDKDAIYYAKELLSERIHNPPSIAELAKSVAINELKLKTGFNRFFQETPYNISLEYRLQEAKKLLEESELNVNEIALKTGYKYVQSFSNAFVKRFGVRPKDIMKSRSYYY